MGYEKTAESLDNILSEVEILSDAREDITLNEAILKLQAIKQKCEKMYKYHSDDRFGRGLHLKAS